MATRISSSFGRARRIRGVTAAQTTARRAYTAATSIKSAPSTGSRPLSYRRRTRSTGTDSTIARKAVLASSTLSSSLCISVKGDLANSTAGSNEERRIAGADDGVTRRLHCQSQDQGGQRSQSPPTKEREEAGQGETKAGQRHDVWRARRSMGGGCRPGRAAADMAASSWTLLCVRRVPSGDTPPAQALISSFSRRRGRSRSEPCNRPSGAA